MFDIILLQVIIATASGADVAVQKYCEFLDLRSNILDSSQTISLQLFSNKQCWLFLEPMLTVEILPLILTLIRVVTQFAGVIQSDYCNDNDTWRLQYR